MRAVLRLVGNGHTVIAIEARSRDDKLNSDKEDAKVEKEYIRVEVKGILHYNPPPVLAGGIQPITGTVVQRGVTIVAKGITWRVAIDMDRKDLDSLPGFGSLKGKTVVAIGTLDGRMSHTELGVEGVRPILVVMSLKSSFPMSSAAPGKLLRNGDALKESLRKAYATFFRRLHLDLRGTIPTAVE